jgi:hypothetical protein
MMMKAPNIRRCCELTFFMMESFAENRADVNFYVGYGD